MMCPEWALLGTVNTKPCALARRCECGEVGPMWAPGVWGKATIMPFVSPLPASSRIPWVVTSCGLLLHLTVGMQLTLVMRTVRTCGLDACLEVVLRGAAFFRAGLAVLEGAALPPALAAFAREGWPKTQHSSAKAAAASANMDRWGAQFAKKLPSRRRTRLPRTGGHRP
jgi:hypothetical protein